MRALAQLLLGVGLAAPAWSFGEAAGGEAVSALARKYTEGEFVAYEMRATHQYRGGTLKYAATAQGQVWKDPASGYFEELQWTRLLVDGAPVELPLPSRLFRERVSLSPDAVLRTPTLGPLHYSLIAPVLDLYTIYSDLALAARITSLTKAGDHVTIAHNRPNSWADGRAILVGEGAIDFDITLRELDRAGKTATLIVRHVPPENPAIRIVADWMRKPVAGTANNWTQVSSTAPGKYTAAIGSETTEVRIVIELGSGKIQSATLENPVEVLERECEDLDLRRCGEPSRYRVIRSIELVPVPASPG